MGQNTVKSDLYDFNDFIKMWGWGWWVALFIVEVCRLVSEILKHKLQVAVIVLVFFNLKEIIMVKKYNISSFLIAKMFEINFYKQF